MIKNIKLQNKDFKYINCENKKINYGLAILKFLLAFSVIRAHNFQKNSTKNKLILKITEERKLHVPSFFIMSFFFTYSNLLSLNRKIFFTRIIRLLLPYILWPVIIWNLNCILNMIFKQKLFLDNYQSLKLQLLWGYSFMTQFWFQWDLIVITLLFYLIILIFRNCSLFILQLLLIISYIFQYSGYNYKKYYLQFPEYSRISIGRLFEMIPFAVTGFNFGYYKVVIILKNYKIKALIFSIVIYNVVRDYNIFTNVIGVHYSGINLNIQSICIFILFSLIPFDNIKSNALKKSINIITKYTAGIFYLHLSIHSYLKFCFNNFKNGTFTCLIINYIISYCICSIGMFFFGKTSFKYLFC